MVATLAPDALAGEEKPLDLPGSTQWAYYPGYEFPGAKGGRRLENTDGRDAVIVSYDFSGGGAYIIAGAKVEIAQGAAELRFDVRADRELKILVRMEDSEKQTHQYPLHYDTPGQWQTMTIRFGEPAAKSFGGPADGTIRYPILKFWAGVGKSQAAMEPGEAAFSNFRLFE